MASSGSRPGSSSTPTPAPPSRTPAPRRSSSAHAAPRSRRTSRADERVLDPEQAHLAALHRLADFRGQGIVELGCGDGRLTVPMAGEATFMLSFDPDAEAVERAPRSLPAERGSRVDYRVASGRAIEVERGSFDLALFSRSP